jgi:hypothetical protein
MKRRREQALALAESQDLVSHPTNEDPTPNKYITPDPTNTTDSSPKLTEEYIVWKEANHLLRGWLIGTLSEKNIRPCCKPRFSLCCLECSKNEYAEDSQEQEFTLRQQVTYLRKENDKTIGEHI